MCIFIAKIIGNWKKSHLYEKRTITKRRAYTNEQPVTDSPRKMQKTIALDCLGANSAASPLYATKTSFGARVLLTALQWRSCQSSYNTIQPQLIVELHFLHTISNKTLPRSSLKLFGNYLKPAIKIFWCTCGFILLHNIVKRGKPFKSLSRKLET